MVPTKNVGILGSGVVAKQLGRGFSRHGYSTMLGSREPSKLESWRKETGGQVSLGTFAQAADHGDPIVVAVMGTGAESAIDLAEPKNFSGKLVIDATNPLDFSKGMPPGLFVGTTDSLGERIQRKLPDAQVVKCFNTVGNVRMIDPKFRESPVPMLICGNDPAAKTRTTSMLRELGWPGTLDVGGIDGARWLEALVPLWVRAGAALNTWEHAFKAVQ